MKVLFSPWIPFIVSLNYNYIIQGYSILAGGILLFIISIEFLTHGEWRYGRSSISGDSGIVPLAFPLLAGPGAITTVIISLQAYGWIVSIISIVFVVSVTYLVLHLENPISRILGRRGVHSNDKSTCNIPCCNCSPVYSRRSQTAIGATMIIPNEQNNSALSKF
jgi:hypothetical protein